MRLSVASSALAAALVLIQVAAGTTPAWGQDFSITNQVAPGSAWRRDVMRQLQTWWDGHAYYPRHASNRDESGTVDVHLVVLPDGRIFSVDVTGGSGSPSLDAAADTVFRGGAVRPSTTAGEKQVDIDLSLHYVLAYRRGQSVSAANTPAVSKAPFTITNKPVKSPILETMLQRTCTGTMVLGGIANHPIYGMSSAAQAIFFRKPDGTPWVKFYERGYETLAPVTQVGKMVSWTGREEHLGMQGGSQWLQYTVWPDGDNHLTGVIGSRIFKFGIMYNSNLAGNYIDFTCAPEVLPTVPYNDSLAQTTGTSPVDLAPGDPP